jgi:hypothetical protein
VITDGIAAQSGPRFIDLRESAAEYFGMGEYIGIVGNRARWRVPLSRVDAEYPFAGWIQLAWGESTSVRRIPVEARVEILAKHRGLKVRTGDDTSFMRVLALPAYTLTRPKEWAALDLALGYLLKTLASPLGP